MNIIKVVVGTLECNCYILEKDNHILIIDPGDDYHKINKKIANYEIDGIIITHYHPDHIGAISDIVNDYHVNVYDISNLTEGINTIGMFTFEVIYNPGHKEDAISIFFKNEKVMFVGDFIFKGSIGRCDLAGGNIKDMMLSIDKIKKYDKDIIIYPGHGEKTTLGFEINNNPYFNNYL